VICLSSWNCLFTIVHAFFNKPNTSINGSGIRSKKNYFISASRYSNIKMNHWSSCLSSIITFNRYFNRTECICFRTCFFSWFRNLMHSYDLIIFNQIFDSFFRFLFSYHRWVIDMFTLSFVG
jgi:hypothetical protein